MTTRNFDALFEPKAIALIGASNRHGSVGAVLARNLFGGGFSGPIMSVNPHETAIRSTLSYPTVAELPIAPDLAIIATPPATVPQLIEQLGARGCRAAVVITAGFGEGQGSMGLDLRRQLLETARPYLMRIVGPNCLGMMIPGRGLNASFGHLSPAAGDIAFLSQSGAVATTMLDWAATKGVGFSSIVSLGDMADVDFGDLLDHFAVDHATRAILLYVESVTEARKFMSAARIAARAKPVIVVKAGRGEAAAKAATSHTGALAGSDAVYDAAFRRAGLLRVSVLRELFEAAATLATDVTIGGDRLTILTNGGGLGVLAVDALEQRGGRLTDLSAKAKADLDAVLPSTWSGANPVDILGDAPGDRYAKALAVLIGEREQDAVLVMYCPTGVADSLDAADAVLATETRTPLLTCWLGDATATEARRRFAARRLPTYETPEDAVRAFSHLVDYRRNQALLLETPAADGVTPSDAKAKAEAVFKAVLEAGRTVLTEPEAKAVLDAYGVPIVETRTVAASPQAAAEAAAAIGGVVALKILSPDITHKSDVGGVRLDLDGSGAVERAAADMLVHVRERAPTARLQGFTVQQMVFRPKSQELIVGISQDATFGPVLLFGQGGVAVEILSDRAMGLPPLNSVLAREMIARTRISKLLKGYRDVPAADEDAIVRTLLHLSQMAVELPQLAELDINPLIVDSAGVIALDARIVVRATAAGPGLAISPYPAALQSEITLSDGRRFGLRPIQPQDEDALVEMVQRSSPDDVRSRFLGVMKSMSHEMAARLSQIDYDREMALVVTDPEDGGEAIVGVVRMIADPNNEAAEFAVMVRSDMKGQGLGYELMRRLLAYARKRGLSRLFGDVFQENRAMLSIIGELGGSVDLASMEDGVVQTSFDLTAPVKEAVSQPAPI